MLGMEWLASRSLETVLAGWRWKDCLLENMIGAAILRVRSGAGASVHVTTDIQNCPQ
jgi:hypothetical protein